MKKHLLTLLLAVLLPLGVFAKPVLLTAREGCTSYWVVIDDETNAVLGSGSYWDPGCTQSRGATPATVGVLSVQPADIAVVKERVAAQLGLSAAAVAQMPVVEGAVEAVVEAGAVPISAAHQQLLNARFGDRRFEVGQAVHLNFNRTAATSIVEQCTIFPVPFANTLTLDFSRKAAPAPGHDLAVAVTAVSVEDAAKTYPLYTGPYGYGKEPAPIRLDVAALPKGRYVIRVTVGKYTRLFNAPKE